MLFSASVILCKYYILNYYILHSLNVSAQRRAAGMVKYRVVVKHTVVAFTRRGFVTETTTAAITATRTQKDVVSSQQQQQQQQHKLWCEAQQTPPPAAN